MIAGSGRPAARVRVGEPAQVAAEQGRERGVDLGRRGALVLAERPDDLVRERHVHVRQRRRERVADAPLVLRVAVGVQQHDRDRLGLGGGDRRRASASAASGVSSRSAPSGVIRSGAAKRSSGGTSGAGRAAHRR